MVTISSHTNYSEESFTELIKPIPEAWEWFTKNKDGDIHIFENTFLHEHVKFDGKIKVGLITEVESVYDDANKFDPHMFHPYKWLKTNYHHFDYFMGCFLSLKSYLGEDRFHYVPAPLCRIPRESFGMYEKERILSVIASFKKYTYGHRLRHEVIAKFSKFMDIYGNGYNNIIDNYGQHGKIIGLAPYCFTLVVLNDPVEDAFSEALTDAFTVGTIPIFWGTKNIGNYFNADGIIQFNDIKELDTIIPSLSKELYMSKIEAVKDNLERSKKYISPIEWMYNHKEVFESMTKIIK